MRGRRSYLIFELIPGTRDVSFEYVVIVNLK